MLFRKDFKFSILTKLIFAFLLVITPLYGLNLMMNKEGALSVNKEISKSMASQTDFYLSSLETEISRTVSLQKELINQKNLVRLSAVGDAMTDYERSQAILTVLNQMNVIRSTGSFIQSVSVYIPIIRRTLTTGSSPIDSLSEEDFEILFQSSMKSDSPIIQWKEGMLSTVVYPPMQLPNQKSPVFMISVDFSFAKIKESLLHFIDYARGGAMIVHPNWTIANFKALNPIDRQTLVQTLVGESGIKRIELDREKFMTVRNRSGLLDAYLVILVPENEIFGTLIKYKYWFWLLCGISIVIILFFSFWIYRFIHQPLHKLVRSFRQLEDGNLQVTIIQNRNDEFDYLYKQFNAMVEKLRITLREVYEQKIRAQRSKLKQLQSQINPHFLYNSFFILNEMVQKYDDEQLDQFSGNLGKYFQYITRNAMDHATLETEVDHVRAYTYIQQTRFSKRLRVFFGELPDAIKPMRVPRIILQPIVENAFRYGMDQKLAGGILHISFVEQDDVVVLKVEDNGEMLEDAQLLQLQQQLIHYTDGMESTGIINIHHRLQIMYGSGAGIRLSRSEYGGLSVEIRIMKEGGYHVQDHDRGR
ncbi:sensor histidine kinase [Cohnella soli]|uniref:Sensor histidine kinase n=1 Tax=Cohnella soli TaxID=425005 RepID=A0ABW0HW74_9BACL